MTATLRTSFRLTLMAILLAAIAALSIRTRADTALCNGANITIPFTDVAGANIFFCSIAAAFFSGLTNGTTTTTYAPGNVVTREQMAAFTSRTLDQSLRRGHSRAALGQWWTTNQSGQRDNAFIGPSLNLLFLATDGVALWTNENTEVTERRTVLLFFP